MNATPTTPAINDKQMFEEIEKRFRQKLRDAVAEVSAEEIQDWGRIERMTEQYGGFLDLFPEAIDATTPTPAKQPRKTKKATAKKAVPAKKA